MRMRAERSKVCFFMPEALRDWDNGDTASFDKFEIDGKEIDE
jgi:hypothetical protein